MARGYVLAPGVAGIALLLVRRRLGWVGLVAAGAVTLFFRDPDRVLEADPDVVYAAADGVVRGVDRGLADPWLPGRQVVRISVFLSIFDVHVNRSPVTGRVGDVEEQGRGYAPAFRARAEGNYRHRLALDTGSGRVVLVLIAGLVARRITRWVAVGDQVATGQRISLIHFGSRTDVLLPEPAEVLVRKGDRVRAGITPMARTSGGATPCASS